jgi:hypothetical protein
MAAVLTVNSTLSCPHQGKLSLSSAAGTLTVGGAAVVTVTDLAGATIGGCSLQTDLSNGLKQCTKVTSVTAGASTTLTVGSAPAALDSAQGLTDGLMAGSPVTWLVQTAGQTSLTAT